METLWANLSSLGALYLAHGAVCLQKVRLQVGIEEVARHALNCIIDRENMDALAILNIRALRRNEGGQSPLKDKIS